MYKHAAGRSEDLERRQCLSDAASAFRRCENSTGTANSYLHIRGFSSRGAVAASVRARASVRTLATPGISLISKWNDVTRAIPTTKIRFSFFFSPPFYIFPFYFLLRFCPSYSISSLPMAVFTISSVSRVSSCPVRHNGL